MRIHIHIGNIISCLLVGVCMLSAHAAIRMPVIFSDHMVLQQKQPVPIWGQASAGEQITVTFAGQTQHAVAGTDGQWRIILTPLPASENAHELVVAGTNTLTYKDVLVGEVWLASGQSNMAMAMKSARRGPVLDADAEIAAAHWLKLRLFQAPTESDKTPEDNCWQSCTPEAVRYFSAVAYFFARELHTTLNVPVGIINASLGGSAIEPWTPPHGRLYTAYVKPLIPYRIRGMIWYQGESNPDLSYCDDQSTLVNELRNAWGEGEFPFYYVQIAPAYDFAPNSLPLLWQSQLMALSMIPNCYMAASGDNGVNLHPPDKCKIGRRLARIALTLTYKKTKEEYSAPVYRSFKVGDGKIRITFTHAKGLHSSDAGPLIWFTIAGKDHVFHPAKAVVDGEDVLVSSVITPVPVAVRFAWDKLAEPNLVNDAGLPAFAFRTDDWPVATAEIPPSHATLTIPRGIAATDLDAARPLLEKAPAQTLQRGGREYARVAWAVAGDTLLMRAHVWDARVSAAQPSWQGASLELYLSSAGTKRVRQIIFNLQGPGHDPVVNGYEMGTPVTEAVPGVWRITQEKDGVYLLEAALPMSFFGIPPHAETFLLDAAVVATPFRGQRPELVWLYSPQSAFCNNSWFAQFK